jgi:hypothetical protein
MNMQLASHMPGPPLTVLLNSPVTRQRRWSSLVSSNRDAATARHGC